VARATLRLHAVAAIAVIVAVASAIWLEPASVHIVSWSATGPVRVALLAPLSRLYFALIATSIAAAVVTAAWRASGRPLNELARAALRLGWLLLWWVPFLPWLPNRAPLLLAFAGPLRWAIAAVAVAGAAAAIIRPAGGAAPARSPDVARRVAIPAANRTVVLGVSFALYAALGLLSAQEKGFTGDEPHYLIIAHSLYADHDLDIANNHANRDYRSFYNGELRPDFMRRGLHGEIYSIHAPGLPVLLLPAYAVGGALGAVVVVAALAAMTALAIFNLAASLAGLSTATMVWAATCFTIPFVPHAWLIYPELPGALIVAWAACWLRQPPGSAGRAAARGGALAALPWLHTKFVVFVPLFALFELIEVGRPVSPGADVTRRQPSRVHPSSRSTQVAALLLPIVVSGVAWLYSFYRMYGEFNPEAPYGSYAHLFVLERNVPRGVLGLLFDQKFGLLAYSPVYVLTGVGMWIMLRDREERTYVAQLLAIVVIFLVSTTRYYMWWGGAAAPARFLVPIIPLLAPMIASAIARIESVAGRALVISTLALSLAIAVLTIGSSGENLLYSDPHGAARLVKFLQGSAPFDLTLPTFTEENWRAPLEALLPWVVASGLVWLATSLLARRRLLQSVFWTGTTAAAGILVVASVLARVGTSSRASIVVRGQLGLMAEYDPSRLRAVDLTHARKIDDAELFAAASISLRPALDASVKDPHVLEESLELPEGHYEARVWFEGARQPKGEAFVGLTDKVVIARAPAPLANPVRLSFELPVGARAFVGLSDADAARAVARIDIAPTFLVPRSARDGAQSRVVEPLSGAIPSFIAYLDDHTYPEGGVFWTRNSEKGTVVVVTAGASKLGLVLHVGPNGGPVAVVAGGQQIDVDLAPDETRELTVPLPPGAKRIVVSVKAARAFRPAEVDPKSDDQRQLGCQVRPVLS
jgi:hypothetical protein